MQETVQNSPSGWSISAGECWVWLYRLLELPADWQTWGMFLGQRSPSGCWKLPPAPKNFGPLLDFEPYHFLCVLKLPRSLSSVPPHFCDGPSPPAVQVWCLLHTFSLPKVLQLGGSTVRSPTQAWQNLSLSFLQSSPNFDRFPYK